MVQLNLLTGEIAVFLGYQNYVLIHFYNTACINRTTQRYCLILDKHALVRPFGLFQNLGFNQLPHPGKPGLEQSP